MTANFLANNLIVYVYDEEQNALRFGRL